MCAGDLSGGLGETGFIAPGDGKVATLCREGIGDAAPDAAAGALDQGNVVLDLQVHQHCSKGVGLSGRSMRCHPPNMLPYSLGWNRAL